MNWDLALRPEAEIAGASDWYEDVTLSALRQNPFQYQVVSGQLRRAKLRGFPCALVYVVSDGQVTVVSCVHGRRDPKIWQQRT